MPGENCFWNYLQGCYISKENFAKWLFNVSMTINMQNMSNTTSSNIVLSPLDRTKVLCISSAYFFQVAKNVFNKVQNGQENRLFPVARTQAFMDKIHCSTLKASSTDKTDIHIILHDQRTRMNKEMGYSIKSRLGGSSTLINSAADSTNFVFSLGKVSEDLTKEFNSLDRFKKKFDLLAENSVSPKWIGVGSRTFYNNLMMIDTCLPWIIGECMLYYYSGKAHTLVEAEALLRKDNPLNFDIKSQPGFYEYKLKQFLLAFALGMTAAKPWNGKFIANGGYIVVKEDGEIVCYHFFDRNELEDYLFNNTYFDTPSTNRHNFGDIYSSENGDLLKLNLQVRFLS